MKVVIDSFMDDIMFSGQEEYEYNTAEQIKRVEDIANELISRKGVSVYIRKLEVVG